MVYKLERSLYGLAQSPVLWYDTIDGVLIVIVFSPKHSDPCVYVHGSGDTLIILTLCVDDILLTGKDPVLVDQKRRELKERFEMTDMGEVTRILGMEVKRDYDQGTLAVTQTDYVENLLERFEMQTRMSRTHRDTDKSYHQSSRRTNYLERKESSSTSPSRAACSISHNARGTTCATR